MEVNRILGITPIDIIENSLSCQYMSQKDKKVLICFYLYKSGGNYLL